MSMTDIAKMAQKLTEAERNVVLWHKIPRGADPVRYIAARGIGDLWRKGKDWETQRVLLNKGILERRYSRGEELFRLTPIGLAVRAHLTQEQPR